MQTTKILALLSVSLFIAGGGIHVHAQTSSAPETAHGVRNDLPQPYETGRNWGELPEGSEWAAVTAVEPSPDGQFIYVIHRCIDKGAATNNHLW